MPRAQFECACGNAFTAAAERTLDFTVDCRQCHCQVRPKAFLLDADMAPRQQQRRPLFGVAHFKCDCKHEFTSHAKRVKGFTCPCYQCSRNVRPARFLPPGKGLKKKRDSTDEHKCSLCKVSGYCPVKCRASGGRRKAVKSLARAAKTPQVTHRVCKFI
jgi:hypothetical protein